MTSLVTDVNTASAARPQAARLGIWASLLTAGAAAAALGIAVTTAPARSGPFCMEALVGTCVTYPYTDAAAFVPNDYLWMYPAFFMGPLFLMLVVCLHYCAAINTKVFSQIAVSFAVIAAAALAANYFIQLTVMQPALLKGEAAGLSPFSQYNPHGIFIALEDLGYLMMSVAFLFTALALNGPTGLERAVRWLFIISFVLAAGSLVGLALIYGRHLDYRFEVAIILLNWPVLIVSGLLLSLFFRRAGR